MMIRVNGRAGTTVEVQYKQDAEWPYVVILLVKNWPAVVSVVKQIAVRDELILSCVGSTDFMLASDSDREVVDQFIKESQQ